MVTTSITVCRDDARSSIETSVVTDGEGRSLQETCAGASPDRAAPADAGDDAADVAHQLGERAFDALGAVAAIAHPEEIDGLHAAAGEWRELNLRGVDLEAAGGDRRGDGGEEAGAIAGDDAEAEVPPALVGHDAQLGDLGVTRRHERRATGSPRAPRTTRACAAISAGRWRGGSARASSRGTLRGSAPRVDDARAAAQFHSSLDLLAHAARRPASEPARPASIASVATKSSSSMRAFHEVIDVGLVVERSATVRRYEIAEALAAR